jgi:hypothetical protein
MTRLSENNPMTEEERPRHAEIIPFPGPVAPVAKPPESHKCAHCGAEFLGGEPPHEMTVYENGHDVIQLYCIECIDYISETSWPDDKWGPYPSRLQHRCGLTGRA